MILNLYCLKDVVIGEYQNPVLYHNDSEAKRAVSIGLSKPSPLDERIGDLQLWRLGSYNSQTGELKSDIDCLANLTDLKVIKKEDDKDDSRSEK